MNKFKHLYLVLLFLGPAAAGQDSFIKMLNVESNSKYVLLEVNSNGDYVLATNVSIDNDTGFAQAFSLVKYNKCDEVLWHKNHLTMQDNLTVMDMHLTANGNILLCGYSRKGNFYDSYIVKFDSNGNRLFSKRIKSTKNAYGYSIGELENGNYFLYGNVIQGVPEEFWNFIMTFDSNGTVLTTTSYFNLAIWGMAIATADGGILSNTGDVIFKTDQNGALKWAKEISGFSYYNSKPIEVVDGFVYVRYSNSFAREPSAFLFKVDYDGNLVWRGEAFESSETTGLTPLQNGHFLVAGNLFVDSATTQIPHVLYTELDSEGLVVRQYLQNRQNKSHHFGSVIRSLPNGQLLHAGTNQLTFNPNGGQIILSKLAYDNLLTGCDLTEATYPGIPEITELTDRTNSPLPRILYEKPFNLIEESASHTLTAYCSKKEDLKLNLGPDTLVCPGYAFEIGSSQKFLTQRWNTGDTSSMISVVEAGTYILTASDGCNEISDTIVIDFYPKTDYQFSVFPKEATPLVPVEFYTNLDSTYNLSWHFSDQLRTESVFSHYFDQNGIFPVKFTFIDEYGCLYMDSAHISVQYLTLFLPNSFTPNGDGFNDVFAPKGFGMKSYTLSIFNRWGELIFKGDNAGWDGIGVQAGTYIYLLNAQDEFDGQYSERGKVNLIR